MTIERSHLRLVWDRSKAGAQGEGGPRVEPKSEVVKDPDTTVVRVDSPELPNDRAKARVTWKPPGEPLALGQVAPKFGQVAPKAGGLHQLALACADVPKTSVLLGGADFTTYRPGMNNRALWGAIAEDLNVLFGVHISYGYSNSLEAFPQMIPRDHGPIGMSPNGRRRYSIGERALDQLLAHFDDPNDRKAVATFAIAHEFFHTLMRHADVINRWAEQPRGYQVKDSKRYERLFELQADYLATKYLILRGLPVEPVTKMFRVGGFEESPAYPSGDQRADNVRRALEPGFDLALFQNDIVDCLAFLDFIAVES